MPAQFKIIVFYIVLMAIFLFFSGPIFAQVVINEFMVNPSQGSDWVELYNSNDQPIYLDSWILDDEGTKSDMVVIKEATISAQAFLVFEVGNRLNKTGDIVYLINDKGQIVDEYEYTDNPGDDVSFGRMPDGEEWGICNQPTPKLENDCIFPSPSPSPSSSTTSSQSPDPSLSPSSLASPSPSSENDDISGGSPSPKPTGVIGTTLLGKVLGEEESSPAGLFPWEAAEEGEEQETTSSSKGKLIPKLFLILGFGFLVVSGVWMWYTHRRELKHGES